MATLHLGSRQAGASPSSDAGMIARIRASRPVQGVLGVAAITLAALAGGVAMLFVELRSREIDETRRSLLNLNALLAESASRTLENVDLVLQSVLEAMNDNQLASADALSRLDANRDFQQALADRVSGLPQLDAITIVDAKGRLVSSSRGFPIPQVDLSDRDHFQRLQAGSVEEPYVTEPVQNRGTGHWTMYLARRILARDGAFVGIVYGGISLDYLGRSYARLALEPGTSISLWRLDGTLLVRHPRMDDVGRRFDTPAFRDLDRDSPPVVYETGRAIDGQPRLVARHVVQGFPVATAVARTRAHVLHQAGHETLTLLLAGCLLAAAVVIVTVALIRQFWAYEAVARAEGERLAALSDLGELEDQLRQSQKLEVLGQVASGIAHDFNNLLTVVIGNLDRLARRSDDADTALARNIEGARSGAERAAALSRRLLGFSRRQPLEPRRIDVNATVSELTDLLQQALGRKAILEIELQLNLPSVVADQSGLETALLNLVVNARDAMPEGGTVTIESRHAAGDGAVCLLVRDTGAGMAPDVARRAFEPFFTTKEPGVGTGLGLAQVASFARESGGTAAIDTEPGRGTRVTLRLPPATPASETGRTA